MLFVVVHRHATKLKDLNKNINRLNYNRLKNLKWREADEFAIYKHERGVELGSTGKQLQLSGLSGA